VKPRGEEGDGREALRVWGEDEAFEVRACDKKESVECKSQVCFEKAEAGRL